MRIHEPLSHWNNFTIPELREILEHCVALEKLGIAQDDEMMVSIERDIALRGKEESRRHVHHISKPTRTKQQTVENHSKPQTQAYLLEQTA
jgi:hypothetical protein